MARWMLALLACVCLCCPMAMAQEDEPDVAPPKKEVHRIDPPDTPVGRQLAWVLKVVNGQEPLGDLSARFSTRFLEVYSATEITTTLTTLRKTRFGDNTVDLVQLNSEDNEDTLSGIINGRQSNRFLSVFIALDEKTGRIAGLKFDQAGYSCAAGDWETYGGEFGRLRGNVSFASYELVPMDEAEPTGPYRLRPVYEITERDADSVSTAYRLWALAVVAQRVADGKAGWDDAITIRDEWKCIPGGPTATLAAGTTLPMREVARRSAAGNDSTATDHLFHTAGRDEIEAYVKQTCKYLGRTFPVLSVREMLFLKLDTKPDVLKRYGENMAEVRRELLMREGIAAGTPNWAGLEEWETPRGGDKVGWFVSVADQCRVWADLRRLEQKPGMEALAEATRINAAGGEGGLRLSPEQWPDVRFVEGVEPGVLSYAWLLRRADGAWYTMAMTWIDTEKDVDEARFLDLARAGFEILAKHESSTAGSAK
ncbi:MAG: hypothetical protein HBSAPP03_24120 [Phycisphaerae bacterium]|nr:MAG: hypothetical protein HBSAPP03_24120 [Phycisphaerae bacterium]